MTFLERGSASRMEPHSYAGRWRRSKAATNAVLEWLHRATKPKSKNAKKKVKKKGARSADTATWTMAQIYAAALEVVDAGTTVPSSVLRDLMVIIRLRFDAYIKLPVDQRDGHDAYVDVLRAVLTKWLPITDDLKTLVGPLKDMRTGRRDRDDVGQRDYFPHLPPFDVDTYAPPVDDAADPSIASLDAQRREMQFACMCFVLDMADLMHDAKLGWIMHKESAMCVSVPTAITNAAVYAIEVLHTELRETYPHLSDLEAIMATLRCGRFIVEIVTVHKVSVDKAAGMLMVARRAAIERLRPLSIQVMTKALSTSSAIAGRLVDRIVAQLEGDDYWNMDWTTTLGKGDSLTALHAYLKTFIVHALREPGTRAITYPDTFGPPWVEGDVLRCTRDLYQSFFADVLPPLLLDAQAGFAYYAPVYENELAPLRRLLTVYVQTQQIPVALLFACQATLWSLFFTQGRSSVGVTVARLAQSTRRAVDDVRLQLDCCRLNPDSWYVPASTREALDAACNWLAHRRRLAAPSLVFTQMEQDRAWYNPYMAGQMMLVLRLEMGYIVGRSVMDDIGQTHMLLHLYHALWRRGKVAASAEMELLADALPQVFVDGRPNSDFAAAHLRSWGYDPAKATAMAATLPLDSANMLATSLEVSSKKTKKPRSLPSLTAMAETTAFRRVTQLELPCGTFADDYTEWMRTLRDEMEGVHDLNLAAIGQLFRGAWIEMADALGYHGSKKHDRAPEVPNVVRFANENRCVQTLLGLCDQAPDDPRLLVAATAVKNLVQRVPEARLVAARDV
ncbi:hypothetical protein SDRG_11217 [Saprolegnia diclina VS20]|uniref:DUF6604 domain-containing protein n=1 Tax=Saprolegnia diclina (strain VS20) TaxID=1156394 RepID=T0QBX6_SAPDV|nr:hypothetical protein SDRG_11217 [Saprolegnia diclina VS20]EQC31030.1 hypothetical protein SDRG_11217 [Saprolegnia diclina VS20]|eukprot:XP_008615469.1 hypothetical protein SDRG_11217 [Saprolegnia diclina VS20]